MRLIDGSFGAAGEAGQVVFDEVARAYADAMSNLTIKPSQIDSVVSQMELLSRFYDAMWLIQRDAALLRVADRLLELARRLQPGRPQREDRPDRASAASGTTASRSGGQSARPSPHAATRIVARGQEARRCPQARRQAAPQVLTRPTEVHLGQALLSPERWHRSPRPPSNCSAIARPYKAAGADRLRVTKFSCRRSSLFGCPADSTLVITAELCADITAYVD